MEYYFVAEDINNVTYSDIEEFILSCLTDNDAIYAIMAIIVNDDVIPSERFVSIGGQIIMTKMVNPMAILNRLESNINMLIPNYGLEGKIIGKLIFK